MCSWCEQSCKGFIPRWMFPPNCHSILEYPKIQWFGGFKWKKCMCIEKGCTKDLTWSASIAIVSPQGSKVALRPELKRKQATGIRQSAANVTEGRDTAYSKCSLLLLSSSKHFSFLCKTWIRAAIQSFVYCNISIGVSSTDFIHRTNA